MGYTHYWTNSSTKPSEEVKQKFLSFLAAIMQSSQVAQLNPEYITADRVALNGVTEELEHESFIADFSGNGKWDFCKTAKKPYDVVVVASLIALEKLDIIMEWTSDGDPQDHAKGHELFNKFSDILK